MREQPGDDVHQTRCRLERLTGKVDPAPIVEKNPMFVGPLVEKGSRLVRKHHRLDIQIVDQMFVQIPDHGESVPHVRLLAQIPARCLGD